MSDPYPKLFSPQPLGPKLSKNRVWMTAHATQLVKSHTFSEEHVAYYAERAKGGVGVMTMEAMAVHPTTQPYAGKVFAFDRAVIPSYQKMAKAVQPHGTLLLAQLWHRGRQTDSLVSRLPVWAPSAVPCSIYRETPHEMTVPEIDEIVEGYRVSAEHAVAGDLDGVEIAGLAHGYLLGQFLSPATNHRNDKYGGSVDGRMRIVLRIIEEVRAVVPKDRILGIRINGADGTHPAALGPQDWGDIAEKLEATDALDYISVSQGTYLDRMRIYGAAPTEPGFQLSDTEQVTGRLSLPTVAVGRITSPEMAENIVSRGTAEFVGMTRQLIADPMWARKAQHEKANDIRPCVGANWCMSAIVKAPLACVHNPAVGRELTLGEGTLTPSATPKRVAVIGGGPAGLRAALTAAQRGHDVTLYEAVNQLGGQIRWIAEVGAYREWAGIVDWLIEQLSKTETKIHLSTRLDDDAVGALGVDHVVVATGSHGLRHGWTALNPSGWGADTDPVPGTDQFNVITLDDVFSRQGFLGPSVMVYDDLGDRQAIVVAEYLRERGHDVSIATRLPQVAPDLAASRDLGAVYRRVRMAGIRFIRDAELTEVSEDTVFLRDIYTDEVVRHSPVDSLVLSTARGAEDTLAAALRAADRSHEVIGDALAPRRIFNAVYEGELAGRAI